MKITTQYNYVTNPRGNRLWRGKNGEVQPTVVPDMAYSVAELLKRVMTGQALPTEYTQKNAIYYPDEVTHEHPDLEEEGRKDFGLRIIEAKEAVDFANEKVKSDLSKAKTKEKSLRNNKLWDDIEKRAADQNADEAAQKGNPSKDTK